MAYCAPQQLSQCLPKIVPKLTEVCLYMDMSICGTYRICIVLCFILYLFLFLQVLTDTHPKVQSAGQTALQQVFRLCNEVAYVSLIVIVNFSFSFLVVLLGWECNKESWNSFLGPNSSTGSDGSKWPYKVLSWYSLTSKDLQTELYYFLISLFPSFIDLNAHEFFADNFY